MPKHDATLTTPPLILAAPTEDKASSPERPPFWSVSATALLKQLGTTPQGLSGSEAHQRLARASANGLNARRHTPAWRLLLAQFQSPIILILLFATGLSFFVHDQVGAVIILSIVLVSGLLGFWQEHGAADAVEKLLALVQVTATVMRDGKPTVMPAAEVVVGDVLLLVAGGSIPGDRLLLESKDLCVNEANGFANA